MTVKVLQVTDDVFFFNVPLPHTEGVLKGLRYRNSSKRITFLDILTGSFYFYSAIMMRRSVSLHFAMMGMHLLQFYHSIPK